MIYNHLGESVCLHPTPGGKYVQLHHTPGRVCALTPHTWEGVYTYTHTWDDVCAYTPHLGGICVHLNPHLGGCVCLHPITYIHRHSKVNGPSTQI